MKIVLMLCLTVFLASCEREDVAIAQEYQSIIGEWKWVESSGGIAGLTYKASNIDSRKRIYNADGTFETFHNDSLESKGTYRIVIGNTIRDENQQPLIQYTTTDSSEYTQSFDVSAEHLVLFDEFYDGFTNLYTRP